MLAAPPQVAPEPPSSQRTIAIIVGAVGMAGLGAGTVFGLMSMSAHATANSACTLGPSHDQCPQSGYDASQNALTYGTVSTVAFVGGGVALAAGAVLWLTAPSASTSATQVGLSVSPSRVALVGCF